MWGYEKKTWIHNLKLKGEVRSEHKDSEITSRHTVSKAMGLNEVDWENCIGR